MNANPFREQVTSLHEVIDRLDAEDSATALREASGRIDVGDPARVSRVILLVSPCRSGTTSLMRVFGAAGIQSHYQELKNVLRWQLLGENRKWQLPQKPDDVVFLKETVGPFTEVEARFNPLDILLGAGFPLQRLQVIIMGRAPLSTWASWNEWDGRWTTVEKLILAYKTTEHVRQQAYRRRIPVTVLTYEAVRDNDVETVAERLFERLDIPYSPAAVRGWRHLPPLGTPGSNVIFPEEPSVFIVPGVHTRVENADGLVYFSREESIPHISAEDVSKIAEAGLSENYEKWRIACEEDLHVSIEKDRDWHLVDSAILR